MGKGRHSRREVIVEGRLSNKESTERRGERYNTRQNGILSPTEDTDTERHYTLDPNKKHAT